MQTTDIPISHICNACALGQGTYPQRLFRKRTGMSMREYRKLKRSEAKLMRKTK
jgi:AraC-like DNA-binding protein